ncbi:MAG: ATP-dependent DNA helicase RecG [Parcubacteria group bacterium]|nr:ATP-dependent DNA helicase RecG [Parcubacteria group bacterium]
MHLSEPVHEQFRLVKQQTAALKKLGIHTARDLLYHFPARYGESVLPKNIAELAAGDTALLRGRIVKIEKTRAFRKKIPLTRAELHDASGKIRVVWFHQPYLATMLREGAIVDLRGKVTKDAKGLYLANPQSEMTIGNAVSVAGNLLEEKAALDADAAIQPVYPESRGITSRWFFYALKKLLVENLHKELKDPIPETILQKYNLPALATALVWIHEPRKIKDAEAARKRFAFEEIFLLQIERQRARRTYQENAAFEINLTEKESQAFLSRLPFSLTKAQEKTIGHILADFKKPTPMSRLLEGDVGSGKTAVAAATAYGVITSRPFGQNFGNLQAALMAPTEILAKQHFRSFVEYFSHLPVSIGLLTGSECKKFPSKVNPREATPVSRAQLLKWVASGEIAFLVGTHALIQKTVRFKHLAYTVIDEQHRFGAMQRYALRKKEGPVPHLLSMTATPIPRTLALTIYGDLDLSLLDEMPPGRKPVITKIVPSGARKEAYEEMRAELKNGRQACVICPKIDVGEGKLEVKNVTDEAARLKKKVFPEYEIAIMHSRLKPSEREDIMERFLAKDIRILVSTSVIEVGVNVPNATVIAIEGAERFGLAQLHQFRGRVLRSTAQAYCYLFGETRGENAALRLRALEKASSGFDLAELDLKMRGPGELSGRKQWGISDLGMEAIKNIKMVEAAREEAVRLITEDPELKNYPLLKERVESAGKPVHLE